MVMVLALVGPQILDLGVEGIMLETTIGNFEGQPTAL